jgi:hypothetical protein
LRTRVRSDFQTAKAEKEKTMKISYNLYLTIEDLYDHNLEKHWESYVPISEPKPMDVLWECQDLFEMVNMKNTNDFFTLKFENDSQTKTYCDVLYQNNFDNQTLNCIFADYQFEYKNRSFMANTITFDTDTISIEQIYNVLKSVYATYSDIYVTYGSKKTLVAKAECETLHILDPQLITEYANKDCEPFDLLSFRERK